MKQVHDPENISPCAGDRPHRRRLLGACCGASGPGRLHHRGDTRHAALRSEEHTCELQSPMRISYAVFCLIKETVNPECMKDAAANQIRKTNFNDLCKRINKDK